MASRLRGPRAQRKVGKPLRIRRTGRNPHARARTIVGEWCEDLGVSEDIQDEVLLCLSEHYLLRRRNEFDTHQWPAHPEPRNWRFLWRRTVARILGWEGPRRTEGSVEGFSPAVNRAIRRMVWPDRQGEDAVVAQRPRPPDSDPSGPAVQVHSENARCNINRTLSGNEHNIPGEPDLCHASVDLCAPEEAPPEAPLSQHNKGSPPRVPEIGGPNVECNCTQELPSSQHEDSEGYLGEEGLQPDSFQSDANDNDISFPITQPRRRGWSDSDEEAE
jgi:hypothetical protein